MSLTGSWGYKRTDFKQKIQNAPFLLPIIQMKMGLISDQRYHAKIFCHSSFGDREPRKKLWLRSSLSIKDIYGGTKLFFKFLVHCV